MYRFKFEENNQTLRPDPRSSTPRFWKIDNWKVTAEFTVATIGRSWPTRCVHWPTSCIYLNLKSRRR